MKNSPTTPIRIVYNCSCCEIPNAASLNDCLMVGSPLLNDLCITLFHFLLHNYAMSTDIQKAFLHVRSHEADRNFTHFVASSTRESRQQFSSFPFYFCPFGTASSPFMLHVIIDLHLCKYQSPVAENIRRNIHVANIISGLDTEAQLMQYYSQARNIMSPANFI